MSERGYLAGVYQGDDDDQEDEDKKGQDDIELTRIK
jgi:hypothetical protein